MEEMMKSSILFAAVLAAVSLPAAAALSQGTEGQRSPPQGQSPQGQGQQGQGAQQGQTPQRQGAQPGQQGQGAQPGQQGQGAQGQTPQSAPQAETKGAALAKEDREFIEEAAQGSLFEVKASQVAVQKAQVEDVKRFAQRMIDDHTAMTGRLQKVAQAKGVNLPQQLDKKHQEKIDSLSKKTGVDFDKAYTDDIVDSHKKDIDNFEKAAKDAKDPSIKEFATTTMPSLREHLQTAQSLKDKVKS
jgi:putative membrane protein